jgi:hypothetical protein
LFQASRNRFKEYGQIYDFMMDHAGDVLVSDPTLGVERAERENYAFFMEITSIEYEIQRRCNLTKVGKLLDEKSYGIAMRKSKSFQMFTYFHLSQNISLTKSLLIKFVNIDFVTVFDYDFDAITDSTYRSVLSRAILDLQHSGKLNELKRKWWEEKRGGGFCEVPSAQSEVFHIILFVLERRRPIRSHSVELKERRWRILDNNGRSPNRGGTSSSGTAYACGENFDPDESSSLAIDSRRI